MVSIFRLILKQAVYKNMNQMGHSGEQDNKEIQEAAKLNLNNL